MARSKQCFIIFFMLVILSAWVPFKGRSLIGEHPIAQSEVSFKAFKKKTAQKYLEDNWDRQFGFRNSLVRLKNSLYDGINFGQFHIAYGRDIVQGKSGMLLSKGYFSSHFCHDRKQCEKAVSNDVSAMRKLHNRLAKYGIPLLAVLEPNKIGFLQDKWPFLWKMQWENNRGRIDYYSLYEQAYHEAGVPVLNLQSALSGHPDAHHFFTRGGIHWSMAGAGAALPDLVVFFNHHTDLHVVAPANNKLLFVRKPYHEEEDYRNLLNVMQFGDRKEQYPYYAFGEAKGQLSLTWYGDSFGNQITQTLVAAGMVPESDMVFHENKLLSQQEAYQAVEKGAPVVMAYTLVSYGKGRIEKEANHFLAQLDSLFYGQGWHSLEKGKWRWTGEKAMTQFLSEGKEDFVLNMTIRSAMPLVHDFVISVNGNALPTVELTGLPDQKVGIVLPRRWLKQGVNTIVFDVKNAVRPRNMQINEDSRILGICVSDLSIDPV